MAEQGLRMPKSAGYPRVILASNRGPLEFHARRDGSVYSSRASGGLVTALASVPALLPVTWISCAMTAEDRRLAARGGCHIPEAGHNLDIRLVLLGRQTYQKYYEQFCNRVLWFLQHYLWDAAYEPIFDERALEAWEKGYVPANRAFASAIRDAAGDGDSEVLVLLHDYHLYLTPALLREEGLRARILHFTHIPWPEPRYWGLVPEKVRSAIITGMLGADIVGFQTARDCSNFLDCCLETMHDARVDRMSGEVELSGRWVRVRAYPISVDPAALLHQARSAEVQRRARRLKPTDGKLTIVRVDRMDPSKNILRGFRALDLLLTRRPDLADRVRFLAFLVPSREWLPEYRRYRAGVFQLVDAINSRHGPLVRVFYQNDYAQALAGLTLYDVLLVNPVLDGMNLVAKEGPIVNERNGVLVLSEGAGAYQQLKAWALTVAPADVDGTARALERALEMGAEERAWRAKGLREAIEREDLRHWLSRQLEDLACSVPWQQAAA